MAPAPSTKRKRTSLPTTKPARAVRAAQAAAKKPSKREDDEGGNDNRRRTGGRGANPRYGKDADGEEGGAKKKGEAYKKPAWPTGPRSTRPRAAKRAADAAKGRKTRADDGESSGSGYEEVGLEDGYSSDGYGGGGGGGDDYGDDSSDDGGMDITAALSGAMPSSMKGKGKARAPLPSQDGAFFGAGGKKKGSTYVSGQSDDDADGDDADYIVEMMEKRNIKDGKAVVKSATAKKGDTQKAVKEATGGGSFQSMGLLPSLLKSIMKKYKTPTPIQRLAIPAALSSPPRDIVAMSRTGSGKTLAYVAPLIQRLQGRHSTAFGARAIVLCPGRELAVQILKVGKEMARGFKKGGGADHAGDDIEAESGSKQGDELRWGLVVGGEGLDEQFEMIASNPDVIIATPGRLLHLVVEMNLDLRSVQYIVFDEADRLFEMGFELQLQEILFRLPVTRQTLLYSATLPKNLVEFAKAGLQNPRLIRLDAESKISNDLQMAFFSVKPGEKEAALISLLREVIQVPLRDPDAERSESEDDDDEDNEDDKRRGGKRHFKKKPFKKFKREKLPQMAAHQTIIFTATKHHVDYLSTLLTTAGYAVSHIYGSLDQTARKQQMDRFRRGKTSILVVTDVAARGIDLPVLENVVNYDFPTGSRVFVHRVGRTARAGRKGSAYSFVTNTELPFFLDLQLFLGRSLVNSRESRQPEYDVTASMYLGTIPRDSIDADFEYITTSLSEANSSLPVLKEVVRKGQAMYERSQGKASQESYRRAKEMTKDPSWGLAGSIGEEAAVHPLFSAAAVSSLAAAPGAIASGQASKVKDPEALAAARAALLASVNSFRPTETIFEIGSRGKNSSFQLMKERRKTLEKAVGRTTVALTSVVPGATNAGEKGSGAAMDAEDAEEMSAMMGGGDIEMADEDDLEATFENARKKPKTEAPTSYKDPEFYMSHYQSGAEHDTKGYSMRDGASFVEQARGATMDLAGDDGIVDRVQRASQITWDRKNKKFVKGEGIGADNKKLLRTESGARLPATYKSGRFDEWKTKNKRALPRTGEAEPENISRGGADTDGRRFRHNKITAPKALDKTLTSYERRVRKIKGAERAAAEETDTASGKGKGNRGGRGAPGAGVPSARGGKGGNSVAAVKNEIRSVDQIRKKRADLAKRKEKNARPSKGGGKGKGRK